MRILLADDSDLILERLQEMLCVFKNVEIVGVFKNGNEALEALSVVKPDLAIIDFRMPGISGLEVVSEYMKIDKTVKFIMITLYSSYYLRHLANEAGVDYFFSKVDDFDKIQLVVSELASKMELDNSHKN